MLSKHGPDQTAVSVLAQDVVALGGVAVALGAIGLTKYLQASMLLDLHSCTATCHSHSAPQTDLPACSRQCLTPLVRSPSAPA